MDEQKVLIEHVILKEFKNNKNATETIKNFSVHYWLPSPNRFSKFRSGDTCLRDETKPRRSLDHDQDTLRELVEWNLCNSTRKLARELNTSESTICRHLKKIRKVSCAFIFLILLVRIRKYGSRKICLSYWLVFRGCGRWFCV